YKRELDRLIKEKTAQQNIKKPSLSEKQTKKLAKLIKKIKLKKINQIKVHWLITANGSILISKIKPFNFINSQATDSKKYETIAVGQSITSGYLTGKVSIIKSKRDLKNFQAGNVAVVDKLTLDHQFLIETCSAILCQRGIEGLNILKKIRHYNIPAIAHLNHLFKRVKNGQLLVVDAGAGKIYQTIDSQPKNKLTQTTRTKLFLAVNQPDNINSELNQISDGLGLIRSEHFYIQSGYHPLKLIRTKKNKLKQRIAHQIINYYHRYLNSEKKPPLMVYRSLNLTSNQLLNLRQGNNFETEEDNPYLGFRGASRYLNQPEIFDFELDLIAHINQKIDQPIILMLPFVRTAFEWQQLQLHIRKKIPKQVLRPQVWLQITTPENLINLPHYFDQNLAGISINIKSIHALMHGIDPSQPDIFNQYQLDTQFFTDQLNRLKQLIEQQTHEVKSLINLHEYNQTIIEQAVKLEYGGITVRPQIVKQVKEQLIEVESRVS
ncbi:MAG: putative PEP-binding protein, partial [Patescibacteria group bacterium]|nr:putative PEP-binding protein [Patescibacteria group bacterium]